MCKKPIKKAILLNKAILKASYVKYCMYGHVHYSEKLLVLHYH